MKNANCNFYIVEFERWRYRIEIDRKVTFVRRSSRQIVRDTDERECRVDRLVCNRSGKSRTVAGPFRMRNFKRQGMISKHFVFIEWLAIA